MRKFPIFILFFAFIWSLSAWSQVKISSAQKTIFSLTPTQIITAPTELFPFPSSRSVDWFGGWDFSFQIIIRLEITVPGIGEKYQEKLEFWSPVFEVDRGTTTDYSNDLGPLICIDFTSSIGEIENQYSAGTKKAELVVKSIDISYYEGFAYQGSMLFYLSSALEPLSHSNKFVIINYFHPEKITGQYNFNFSGVCN